MCDLCYRDSATIITVFTDAARKIMAPPRTEHDAPLVAALLLVCEAQRLSDDPKNESKVGALASAVAAKSIQSLTADDRSSALHFLTSLRRAVAAAEMALGTAKHVLKDADAEDRAPGLAGTAAEALAQSQPNVNPFGTRIKPDLWN